MNQQTSFDFIGAELSGSTRLLYEWIQSGSMLSASAFADYLFRYLTEQGYEANRYGNHIWMMAPGFDTRKKTLLLATHCIFDKHSHPIDLPKETICNQRIYGPYAGAWGGCLASLLHAYLELCREQEPYNLIFAALTEGLGHDEADAFVTTLPTIDFCIIAQATGMQLIKGEKGYACLHGICRENGEQDAIMQCAEDIYRLQRADFTPGQLGNCSLEMQQINGNSHTACYDFRWEYNECHTAQEWCVKQAEENYHSSFEVREDWHPCICPDNHPLLNAATIKQTQQHEPIGHSLLGKLSCPGVKIGPGGTVAHSIDVADVDNAAHFYKEWLHNINW